MGGSSATQSAIIVVYKTPAELAALVASLRSQPDPPEEIIVIDNGACEGAPVPELAELAGVRVERPDRNLGFGAGCNLGATLASGEALLFLNADVIVTLGATDMLARRLLSESRVAAVGPRVYSGGKLQASARNFPSVRTGLLGRRSLLTRLLVGRRRLPKELRYSYGGGGEVDWISGACMMVRREAFEEVGGFDEAYWMYWEDADLCRRLWEAGWSVRFEPSAVIQHATGASGTSAQTIRAFHESAALFAERWIVRTTLAARLTRWLLRTRSNFATRSYGRRGP